MGTRPRGIRAGFSEEEDFSQRHEENWHFAWEGIWKKLFSADKQSQHRQETREAKEVRECLGHTAGGRA